MGAGYVPAWRGKEIARKPWSAEPHNAIVKRHRKLRLQNRLWQRYRSRPRIDMRWKPPLVFEYALLSNHWVRG